MKYQVYVNNTETGTRLLIGEFETHRECKDFADSCRRINPEKKYKYTRVEPAKLRNQSIFLGVTDWDAELKKLSRTKS